MHSSEDRDKYITVQWDNIEPEKKIHFEKYGKSSLSHIESTYDYFSVMHYGLYGFSKNNKPTILPKVSLILR